LRSLISYQFIYTKFFTLPVFSYLDELIEKQENPTPRKAIGFKTSGNQNI